MAPPSIVECRSAHALFSDLENPIAAAEFYMDTKASGPLK